MGEPDGRRRVVDALAGNPDGLSVTELIGLLGASDSQVRRTLMALIAAGAVTTVQDASTGPGRPTLRFRLAQSTSGWPALAQMLVALQARMGPTDPNTVREVGRGYGAGLASGDSSDGVLVTMARFGFSPRDISSRRDEREHIQRLSFQTCAFRDAALADGGHVVCILHRGLVEGISATLGEHMDTFEIRGPITGGCQVRVRRVGPRISSKRELSAQRSNR